MNTGCIEYVGCITNQGYGRVGIKGKYFLAHVLSYIIFKGKINKGFEIDHICRNRKCINPEHLRQVTHKENVLCGISPIANNKKKVECVHGHCFDDKNTHTRKDGTRQCKTCRHNRLKEWRLINGRKKSTL